MLRSVGNVIKVCQQTVKVTRSISFTPVSYQAVAGSAGGVQDPIQQLFVQKVREYAQKSKAAGGKLVDATASTEAKYNAEIERVQKQYGVKSGEDVTKFPTFNFEDVELEPVTVNVDMKAETANQDQAEELEKDDTPFFVV